jgi:hypothetical protein
MKCLTVCQPWAWAIVYGPKRIENRTWPTSYRGPLLIHAGKSRSRLGDFGPDEPEPAAMSFGAIIGLAELVDCVPVQDVAGQPFAEGPWCWRLGNVRPLKKIVPMPGRLSLWDPGARVVRKVLKGQL